MGGADPDRPGDFGSLEEQDVSHGRGSSSLAEVRRLRSRQAATGVADGRHVPGLLDVLLRVDDTGKTGKAGDVAGQAEDAVTFHDGSPDPAIFDRLSGIGCVSPPRIWVGGRFGATWARCSEWRQGLLMESNQILAWLLLVGMVAFIVGFLLGNFVGLTNRSQYLDFILRRNRELSEENERLKADEVWEDDWKGKDD